MRKLKLQVQMSVDGFVAGPQGQMDWLIFNWTEEVIEHVTALTEGVGTILLGRKLAEGFIPHWTASYNSAEPLPGAETFVKTPKVVFSKSMSESIWDNTVVKRGDLATEVRALKEQEGGPMIAYGGAGFVSSLIREKLVDELHLFVNPAILGEGMPIFRDVADRQSLKLVEAKGTASGIVILVYAPA